MKEVFFSLKEIREFHICILKTIWNIQKSYLEKCVICACERVVSIKNISGLLKVFKICDFVQTLSPKSSLIFKANAYY